MYIELIGIIASALILISMLIKSTSKKGNLIMRIINLLGSLVFVVYGFLIPAYSTAIMNIALTVVNAVYIVQIVKDMQKSNA